MNLRTTRSTVTFTRSLLLPGYDKDLPAGDYDVMGQIPRSSSSSSLNSRSAGRSAMSIWAFWSLPA